MVKRSRTQARPSCTSCPKKKKKKSSELLRALTAAKEGRVWKDERRRPCPDLAGCVWASHVAHAVSLPFWTLKILLAGCWWD